MASYGALAATPTDPPALEENWLAATLNGQPADDVALFLRTPAGRLLAPAALLKTWRLRIPSKATESHGGEPYVPLDALPGVSYSIDEEKQVLILNAPAKLFEPVTLNLSGASPVDAPLPPLGVFLNYDLAATRDDSRTTLSGLVEGNVFGPAGAGTMQYLVIHRGQSQITEAIRLDTTWQIDHPDSVTSLRIGDSITGSSAWGGAARFGGIQWGSNYATRPGLITMPLPSLVGETGVPSSLDLYVDNMLRSRSSLPGGPFRIDDVPVITGSGDVRLVVRDLLGREQVISAPYYASPELLRAGLQEYSVEAGVLRKEYGILGNAYGQALIVATDRIGLTDTVTGEIHAEALKDQQAFGLSSSIRLWRLGVLDTSVATSHSGNGQGELVRVGFAHSARWLSMGGSIQYSSRSFERLGALPEELRPSMTSQLFLTIGLGHFGSFSVSHTRENYYEGHSIDISSVRDSINVGWLGYLTLAANRVVAGTTDTTVTLGLSHPINARTGLTSTVTSDSASGTTAEVNLQRNLPAGPGIGYRLIAEEGATRAIDATTQLQGNAGTYELEARAQSGSSLVQMSASGGVAMLAGHVFPTRRIDGSFAAVQVGDQNGVRIYRENQLVGQTNAGGYLLVPGLRAYQSNDIRIEQADLPLDVVLDTVQAPAVPYSRSGVYVKFPVDHPRGALLSVQLESGGPLPPGAVVRVMGQEADFPSGMNGEVYVTGLAERNEIHVDWVGGSCGFAMAYTSNNDPLPRLGPYICKSVPP